MSKFVKHFCILIFCIFLLNGFSIAGEGHQHFSGDPIKAMAEMVIKLKHFPSKSEKKQLKDIISHSDNQNVKTIATALVNMRHSAKEEDKAKLKNIINSESASSDLKALAKVVHELNNHQLKLVGSYYGLKVRIRVKDPLLATPQS